MNTREEYEKFVNNTFRPVTDTSTYEDRIGQPEELPAVIGLISMKFSYLEDTLSNTIIKMLQLDDDRGHIITAELSFRVKVNVFASLYQKLKANFFFNAFPDFEEEYFKELVIALNKCEEMRNQVLHSSFTQSYLDKTKIIRTKVTAKQKSGLRKAKEETNIVNLFNIADFIGQVEFELDEFGINIMGEKNSH